MEDELDPGRPTLPGRGPRASARPAARPRGAASLDALRLGLRLGAERALGRRGRLVVGLALALAGVAALVERSLTSTAAADRALVTTFRIVVPLAVFALVSETTGRDRLSAASWPLARFGAPGRAVALGVASGAALVAAALGALAAALAVGFAHGPGAAPLAADLGTSAWIGALAGACYAGWFALGATFLDRGRGRLAPLVLDFVLGGTAGLAGAIFPRGNVTSLLGGPAPMDLPQPASAALLGVGAMALLLLAAFRSRR